MTKLLEIKELREEGKFAIQRKITLQKHCIPAMKRTETTCSLFSGLSVPFNKIQGFPQAVQGSYFICSLSGSAEVSVGAC